MTHHIEPTLYIESAASPLYNETGRTTYDKCRSFVAENAFDAEHTDCEMLGLTALALLAFDKKNQQSIESLATQDIGAWTLAQQGKPEARESLHMQRSAKVAIAVTALRTLAMQYGKLEMVEPPFVFGNLVREGIEVLTEDLRFSHVPLDLTDQDIMQFIHEVQR